MEIRHGRIMEWTAARGMIRADQIHGSPKAGRGGGKPEFPPTWDGVEQAFSRSGQRSGGGFVDGISPERSRSICGVSKWRHRRRHNATHRPIRRRRRSPLALQGANCPLRASLCHLPPRMHCTGRPLPFLLLDGKIAPRGMTRQDTHVAPSCVCRCARMARMYDTCTSTYTPPD